MFAGEWVATGINPCLLFGRYLQGGHFAPHTDGCTVIDFNNRTLYTVIIYLNDCLVFGLSLMHLIHSQGGGETHLMKEEQLHNMKLENGSYVGSSEYIISTVSPIQGKSSPLPFLRY